MTGTREHVYRGRCRARWGGRADEWGQGNSRPVGQWEAADAAGGGGGGGNRTRTEPTERNYTQNNGRNSKKKKKGKKK